MAKCSGLLYHPTRSNNHSFRRYYLQFLSLRCRRLLSFHWAAYELVGLHGPSLSIASSKKNTSLCRRNTEMATVSSVDGSTPRSASPGKPGVTWSDRNSCWKLKKIYILLSARQSLQKLNEILHHLTHNWPCRMEIARHAGQKIPSLKAPYKVVSVL